MKRALASFKSSMVVVLSRSELTVGVAIIGMGFLTEMSIIESQNYKDQVVYSHQKQGKYRYMQRERIPCVILQWENHNIDLCGSQSRPCYLEQEIRH